MPYHYRAYGLTVESDLLLPELPRLPDREKTPLAKSSLFALFQRGSHAARGDLVAEQRKEKHPTTASGNKSAGTVDIRIRASQVAYQPKEWSATQTLATGEPWLLRATLLDGYLLHFPGLAEFAVNTDGNQIDYQSEVRTSGATFRHLLLDHVLPLTLSLRGIEVLHATAVLTSAGVWAFAGPSGVGKSTLAASLAQSGMTVLCDDCLVLQESHGPLLAVPAYPGVRLWEDALAVMTIPSMQSVPVSSDTQKRRCVFDNGQAEFPRTAQPITRIYSLVRLPASAKNEGDAQPQIERLSPREGCVELLPHLYRFDNSERSTFIRQLAFLERLVSQVPVRRLFCPSTLAALPAVRRVLCDDRS